MGPPVTTKNTAPGTTAAKGSNRLLFSACDFRLPPGHGIPLRPPRRAGRPITLLSGAALAAWAALAGCSGSGRTATLPLPVLSQRYQAAMDPANAALNAMVQRALAYNGGSPAGIDRAAPGTAKTLRGAADQVSAISAPAPVKRDIVDVSAALNTVVADLSSLGAASGNAIQPAIAKLVADAGREAAADNLVRLALSQLTSPTTITEPPVVDTTTTEAPTTTTSVAHRTTTTRAKATTTVRPTSTLKVATTSTVKRP